VRTQRGKDRDKAGNAKVTSTHGRGDGGTKSKRKGYEARRKETDAQRSESRTGATATRRRRTQRKRQKKRKEHTEITMFRRALGIKKKKTDESDSSARRE
jgi:hypothetical protein